MTSPEPILACRLDAFDADERARHAALLRDLGASVEGARELENGYAFQLAGGDATHARAGEWIALERRCCPFLSFELTRAPDGVVTLSLTGPAGVKTFLAAEMSLRA